MKQLIIKYSISISLIIFTACSTSSDVSPSQNGVLSEISNSNANNGKGALQGMLDSFIEDDWTPTVTKDEEIQKKYMQKVEDSNISHKSDINYVEKEDRYFTLQEYADKRAAYVKAHPADHNNSHVHKLEMMPVIGDSKRR
jgi:hypothetical protein